MFKLQAGTELFADDDTETPPMAAPRARTPARPSPTERKS
jgi:hypothetical protein